MVIQSTTKGTLTNKHAHLTNMDGDLTNMGDDA
jgi:hypothetical protein